MIDFRYHIVSLAAVLIALSIGVVLGAGPLNDNIGSTLSGEVTKLRDDKEALRAESNEKQQVLDAQESFDEAVVPRVVAGELTERTVAVVALPQADDDTVKGVRETLTDSGATVPDTVRVTADWAVAGRPRERTRAEVGRRALADLGTESSVPRGAQDVDQALATVLTGRVPDVARSAGVPRSARDAAWDRLRDADLLRGGEEAPSPADLVVVVGGPVPADEDSSGSTIDPVAEAVSAKWVALAHVVDRHAEGSVLAATEKERDSTDASPVTMARIRGSLAEEVSTVDVPELPLGRADIVLALVEQLDGEHGHYGLGADADDVTPELS